jgi:hypothetical protein
MGDLMVDDTSAFIADMGPSYEDLEGDGSCTGSVWATGEDGMQTIDHDGPCPVHDHPERKDMTEKEITRATPDDAGCWIDGHWGQYGIARMIEIASLHGYVDPATTPPFAQQDIVEIARRHLASMGPYTEGDDGISDDEHEQLSWTYDDVEAWMNDNVAPEGFSFGWHDGEFFLWSNETWADDAS